MNPIGIMQGRLSARPPHRIQAFPTTNWPEEFSRAQELGLDHIEWLFESDNWEMNPILANPKQIEGVMRTTGVSLSSVCADFFMDHLLFREDERNLARHVQILEQLILAAAKLGARVILLPVLESSALRNTDEADQLLRNLKRPLDLAQRHGVKLGLEMELPAEAYLRFIEKAKHSALGAYYDIGNAAAKGFRCERDIALLARHLVGVHVKDRLFNGPTVPLGEGTADFQAAFAALVEGNYGGPLILQTAFGLDYMGCARRHIGFARHALVAAYRANNYRVACQ